MMHNPTLTSTVLNRQVLPYTILHYPTLSALPFIIMHYLIQPCTAFVYFPTVSNVSRKKGSLFHGFCNHKLWLIEKHCLGIAAELPSVCWWKYYFAFPAYSQPHPIPSYKSQVEHRIKNVCHHSTKSIKFSIRKTMIVESKWIIT